MAKEFNRALAICRLDKAQIVDVSRDQGATKWGVFILSLPFVVQFLLAYYLFPNGLSSIFTEVLFWPILISLVSIFVTIFFLSFVAGKFFAAKKGYVGFFRVISYASIVYWLGSVVLLIDAFLLSGFVKIAALVNFISTIAILFIAFEVIVDLKKISVGKTFCLLAIGFVFKFLLSYSFSLAI